MVADKNTRFKEDFIMVPNNVFYSLLCPIN